jgi:uncharacterized protein YuzE
MKKDFSFKVSVETNERTGQVMAAYFRIRKGKAETVKEFGNGALFANYGRDGELIGVEMLAPCEATVFDRITDRQQAKSFIKRNAPRKRAWSEV